MLVIQLTENTKNKIFDNNFNIMKLEFENTVFSVEYELSEDDINLIFDKDDNNFNISLTNIFPKAIPEPDLDLDSYSLFFLKKKDLRENDIFEVKICQNTSDAMQTTGFIIPVASIESAEHSYADNETFWSLAKASLLILLKKQNFIISFANLDTRNTEQSSTLSDILGTDTSFLIIKENNFDISSIIPSIVGYGFVLQKDKIFQIHDYAFNRDLTSVTSLEFLKFSPDLESVRNSINKILEIYISQINNIFRFFILYQIIEILMHEIFKNQHSNLLSELTSQQIENVQDIRALTSTINKFTGEAERLNKLRQSYAAGCFSNSDMLLLKEACWNYLDVTGNSPMSDKEKSKLEHFDKFIYSVRNRLFHNFRLHTEDANQFLGTISDELTKIFPKILNRYRNPSDNSSA